MVSFVFRDLNETRSSLFATELINRPADIAEIDDVVEGPVG
jgi:hypothetical protein